MDHTTCELRFNPSDNEEDAGYNYTSEHKGVCVKYLWTTTPQGNPIAVSCAGRGRAHDFALFDPPLVPHYSHDFVLADSASRYRGFNGHVIVPKRGGMKSRQQYIRSRIEKVFTWVKRFRILNETVLDAKAHELFVRFVAVCEHAAANIRRECINVHHYPVADKDMSEVDRGLRCICNWRKRERENDEQ